MSSKKKITDETTYIFTEEDLVLVQQIKNTLQPDNSVSITTFGSDVQKEMADLSGMVLKNLGKADNGAVTDLLNRTLEYLGTIEKDESEKGGFFWKKKAKGLALKSKYDAVSKNVEQIERLLEAQHMQLLMDSALMDQLYKMNREYFRQLQIRIRVAAEVLEELKKGVHPAVSAHASDKGWLSAVTPRIERKKQELEITAMVASQQAPQLLMLQTNTSSMAEGVQATLYNVIPLWKNQMVTLLGNEQARQEAASDKIRMNRMLMDSLESYAQNRKQSDDQMAAASTEFTKLDATIHTVVTEE